MSDHTSNGNTAFDYDLVCIGSGPAGQRAAIQAAKLGKRAAVIEKSHDVGGVCVTTGTIPSKTFREAVRRYYSRPGLEGDGGCRSSRPTMLSLVDHVGRVIEREMSSVRDALRRNDIDMLGGSASFIDKHTINIDNHQTVTAENILIAVGTKPSQPRGVDSRSDVVITSDHVLDLKELPRTMAIVGAGVIGIEYASMFAALGVQVTVVDKRERPLEFLDREIVDELVHQLRIAGVVMRSGEGVKQIRTVKTPKPIGVIELESGKHIVADVILFSAGRVGATEDLNLEAIDLPADDRGRLSVGEGYRTEVPNIFAAGDVIGFPALAATSSEQGRIAACQMFDVIAEPMGDHFPVGIYAIPECSMVGLTEEQLTSDKIPYETGIARYSEISRGQIVGDDSGMFKMLFHRETGKLLGVHCIGSGATELVHIGQAVLALGGGLDYFLNNVFNYPTLAECYKVAAHNAANKLALMRNLQLELV